MDPVWTLFWSVMALFVGFLVSFVASSQAQAWWLGRYERWRRQELELTVAQREPPWGEYVRDIMLGLAVLTSFVGIGFVCGALLGNSWAPAAVITFALAAGLSWGAFRFLPPRPRPRMWDETRKNRLRYERTWAGRLERWGFPSSRQMELAVIREDLRGRLALCDLRMP